MTINEKKKKVTTVEDESKLHKTVSKFTLLLWISVLTTIGNYSCILVSFLIDSQRIILISLFIWSIDSFIDGICTSLIFEFNDKYFECICSCCRDCCQRCFSQRFPTNPQMGSQMSMKSMSHDFNYDSPRDKNEML